TAPSTPGRAPPSRLCRHRRGCRAARPGPRLCCGTATSGPRGSPSASSCGSEAACVWARRDGIIPPDSSRRCVMLLRNVTLLSACLVVLLQTPLAAACGFSQGTEWIVTISQDAATAKYILVGKLTNPKKEPGEGSTDFVIEQVVKG